MIDPSNRRSKKIGLGDSDDEDEKNHGIGGYDLSEFDAQIKKKDPYVYKSPHRKPIKKNLELDLDELDQLLDMELGADPNIREPIVRED